MSFYISLIHNQVKLCGGFFQCKLVWVINCVNKDTWITYVKYKHPYTEEGGNKTKLSHLLLNH